MIPFRVKTQEVGRQEFPPKKFFKLQKNDKNLTEVSGGRGTAGQRNKGNAGARIRERDGQKSTD